MPFQINSTKKTKSGGLPEGASAISAENIVTMDQSIQYDAIPDQ